MARSCSWSSSLAFAAPQPICCLSAKAHLPCLPLPCPPVTIPGCQPFPVLCACPHLSAFPSRGSFCPEALFWEFPKGHWNLRAGDRGQVTAITPVMSSNVEIRAWSSSGRDMEIHSCSSSTPDKKLQREAGVEKKVSPLPQVRPAFGIAECHLGSRGVWPYMASGAENWVGRSQRKQGTRSLITCQCHKCAMKLLR